MTDFTAVRPHIYVSGAVILAANHNENENGIYNPFNASINGTTGHTHSGATGDGPVLTDFTSTTKGMRIPRFTAGQQTTYLAGTPLSGAIWFNSTTAQFVGYNGTIPVLLG